MELQGSFIILLYLENISRKNVFFKKMFKTSLKFDKMLNPTTHCKIFSCIEVNHEDQQ